MFGNASSNEKINTASVTVVVRHEELSGHVTSMLKTVEILLDDIASS